MLGEDTDMVLQSLLDLDADEIDALRQAEVI
jgi:crotonobetainyl-CoA:carnitine CoA-transferase CaiB-like acyl-CoA transferase